MAAGYVPDQEEREHAFYAHVFAALANILTCGMLLPVGAPLVALMMAKQKKPFLLFHVNQSLVFQAACCAAAFSLWMAVFVLSLVCIGWLLIPLPLLVTLAGTVYPIVVGMAARNGEWKEYPVIGPKVLREWKPFVQ
jgi:uncharacterized Tic20 family protein